MKTLEIQLFNFEELSKESKENAIQQIEGTRDYFYIWDESYQTVKKFNYIFDLKEGYNSWLNYQSNFDENIENLKGLRLRKYILNNYFNSLYKGKYYSTSGYFDDKNKYHYKKRYSKCQFENCCVLTGLCYDDDILKPIYELIEYKKENRQYLDNINIYDIFNSCFDNLKNSIENEIQYNESKEGIIEHIISNDINFLSTGQIY
tara:strand:- start:10520 stop:11131 length:612 start_codon:yes stop_codon:yes gene_type:complete